MTEPKNWLDPDEADRILTPPNAGWIEVHQNKINRLLAQHHMNVHGKPSPHPELQGWLVEQQVPKTRPRTVAALCELINQFELQDRFGDAAECLRSNSSQGISMWCRAVIDPSI